MPHHPPPLIVALDVPGLTEAQRAVDQLPDEVMWYKVGLELFTAAGPEAIHFLRQAGKHVFLDLKLHDIPNTVASAVEAAAAHDVQLLTVHTVGGKRMMAAAVEAARKTGSQAPKLIGVTTLTSLTEADLADVGIHRSVPEQALALGQLALESGLDGLVCSAQEVDALRHVFGPAPVLVTPGIRLPGEAAADQRRIATPTDALRRGASYLVVGRSLLQAPDPAAQARRLLDLIQAEQ